MATYNPGGKPNMLLERLDEADCDFAQLAVLMPGATQTSRKTKAFHTLSNMIDDGLVGGGRARYFLTQAGRDLLQGLRAGSQVALQRSAPNVRVFS